MTANTGGRVDVDAAEARARRAQDGMAFNREAMFREHIQMAKELRQLRAAFERFAQQRGHTRSEFDVFDDIFGGLFDGRR